MTSEGRPSPARLLHRLLYLVSFAVVIGYLADGFSYYTTPYAERPHREEYASLRPAGTRGLGFGVVGSAMLLLMLFYSLRKRTKLLGKIGTLRQWLSFHIYLGVMGPLLILLHTSFKVQGLVAVGFWAMVLVALSGVFGRYIYQQIPRNIQGTELSLQELEQINQDFANRLRSEFGLTDEAINRFDRIGAVTVPKDLGPLMALATIIDNDLLRLTVYRRQQWHYAKSLDLPKVHRQKLMELERKRALLRRKILLLGQAHQLFHYWHVIHKPFAIVMYLIMAVHISVAVWTGYTWIF